MMTSGDDSLERASELDRLIEARRAGELPGGSEIPAWASSLMDVTADLRVLGEIDLPDQDALWARVAVDLTAVRESEVAHALDVLTPSSAVEGLNSLRREIELPDEDSVWSRVSAGIAADRATERAVATAPWWQVGPFGRRPRLWGPVGAVAAVLIVVVVMLAQPPVSTAEAFVRDVEALSALADAALADDVLTDDEKNSVADLALELRLTIVRQPETLVELDALARSNVLATLADVTARLTPIADEELMELRASPPPGLRVAADAVERDSDAGEPPATAATSLPDTTDGASPTLDEDTPGRGSEMRSDSAPSDPPGLSGVAPVVASSVTSLHEVAEAVQGAGEGSVPSSVSTATPGYLLGLCRELRGQERAGCQRAINVAIAACAGAADRDALEDCADASAFASDMCEALLPAGEASRCREALAGLESDGQAGAPGARGAVDSGRIDSAGNDDVSGGPGNSSQSDRSGDD